MDVLSDIEVQCPFCGELFQETVDTLEAECDTIVDCPVCCRPIHLQLECRPGEAHLRDTERG